MRPVRFCTIDPPCAVSVQICHNGRPRYVQECTFALMHGQSCGTFFLKHRETFMNVCQCKQCETELSRIYHEFVFMRMRKKGAFLVVVTVPNDLRGRYADHTHTFRDSGRPLSYWRRRLSRNMHSNTRILATGQPAAPVWQWPCPLNLRWHTCS